MSQHLQFEVWDRKTDILVGVIIDDSLPKARVKASILYREFDIKVNAMECDRLPRKKEPYIRPHH